MRVRLDDSSQISKDKATSALSDSQQHHGKRSGLSPPIKKGGKMGSPELDLDDDIDSINDKIPKARAVELVRLREENHELKAKLSQLKQQRESHDAAPLGMTTFSPARESQS